MSEEQGSDPPSPPAGATELRFGCPYCRMELTAPLSAAGVAGPCPRCGEKIQAPPVPSAGARKTSEAPTPATLPAKVGSKLPPLSGEVRVKKKETGEVRVERRVRKRRSKSSAEAKKENSFEAEERREAIALLKVVLAVLATLVITMVVCWIVWKGIMESPIPPAL